MNHQFEKTCALTGHRDVGEELQENVLYDILEDKIRDGYSCFLCGMARGFDLLALKQLVSLKRKYKIRIEACIPYAGHGENFSREAKKEYRELLEWCDEKNVMFENYRGDCFLARDRYMVERCDEVLAYCKKQTGGTYYTVKYAESKGIPVVYID